MQRQECLVTLWVFICFLTHMLLNYTGPSIPFLSLLHPPKNTRCNAAGRQHQFTTSEQHPGSSKELLPLHITSPFGTKDLF